MSGDGTTETIFKQAQAAYGAHPAIVLGSGASIPFGIPSMGDLAGYLIENINAGDLGEKDASLWAQFVGQLESDIDLETALHQIQLTDPLSKQIVKQTWRLINPSDYAVFQRSLTQRNIFPLSMLIRRLFDSTHRTLEVVTTNYDRLAEYATECAGFLHYTGFTYGYTRRMEYPQTLDPGRVVNVWKVHGSLDWYKRDDGEVIGLANLPEFNDDLEPVIVTPGIEKYRQTHLEPYRSIIQGADQALSGANAYLCVGYGFNDQHIQEKLVNRCTRDGVPIVVLARTLTAAARDFLLSGRCADYLVFEKDGDGTRVYSSLIGDPFTIDDRQYWSLESFLELII